MFLVVIVVEGHRKPPCVPEMKNAEVNHALVDELVVVYQCFAFLFQKYSLSLFLVVVDLVELLVKMGF